MEYNTVDVALKHHIVQQYDDMYLTAVYDYMVGFANVSALYILLHLGATYGHITPTELVSNYNIMTVYYDIQDPVAGQQFYHEAQYINIAFLIILNIGALPEEIHEWQCRAISNQTWARLKILFANDHREYRLITATASRAGFQKVHVVVGQQGGLDFSRDTSAALDNLPTVTSAERETVAGLTKTMMALMVNLDDRDAWSKSQNDEIKRLIHINSIVPGPAVVHNGGGI
jgi:hypothetical protein